MNDITIEKLISIVDLYNDDDKQKQMIFQAYSYAFSLHNGQFRQSGEPYIVHPLTVAYILAEMHADSDTLCAALLHDTLEDTEATKEEIELLFNSSVANLVDGVTKMSKMNFSTKQDQNMANTRKIVTGLANDVRIIIIKLADRLHNMRTLQFKSEFKQKENSLETMEIFVPLAYYIGAYRIKSELEDLSFKYLKPDQYKEIEQICLEVSDDSKDCLREMLETIKEMLEDKSIPNEIKVRTKNIYGIYKRLTDGYTLANIHDLLSLKVMVDNVSNCYLTLGMIHSKYRPVNNKFKDYICNPKTNMYRSLHTTLFGDNARLVQTQIRTFEMDKVASFGLLAYWDMNRGDARSVMQEELSRCQFYRNLMEIDEVFGDNIDFVKQIKSELFSPKIYVSTVSGETIELPVGSTPVDFAYQIGDSIGNRMIGVVVNDSSVPINYQLKNKDRVKILTSKMLDRQESNLLDFAHTTYAKKKLLEKMRPNS